MARAAVILSGCGVYDGSEIHESVSVLLHLSQAGAEVQCFAPNTNQAHVVDHIEGKPVPGEQRNVLRESARIARGNISPLSELRVSGFDALFLPGGFGAAKNLSDFAFEGAGCSVDPEVEQAILSFHSANKPIGMCCIAPVIAAKVLGTKANGPGCEVTIGSDQGAAAAIAAMGSTHVSRQVTEAHVDERNLIVTAPAYMYGDASLRDVHAGIGAMVDQVLGFVVEATRS